MVLTSIKVSTNACLGHKMSFESPHSMSDVDPQIINSFKNVLTRSQTPFSKEKLEFLTKMALSNKHVAGWPQAIVKMIDQEFEDLRSQRPADGPHPYEIWILWLIHMISKSSIDEFALLFSKNLILNFTKLFQVSDEDRIRNKLRFLRQTWDPNYARPLPLFPIPILCAIDLNIAMIQKNSTQMLQDYAIHVLRRHYKAEYEPLSDHYVFEYNSSSL